MESKSILKSKTFWVNLIAGVLAVAAGVNHDYLSKLGLTPEAQGTVLTAVGAVVAILNIALRTITSTEVTLPSKKK